MTSLWDRQGRACTVDVVVEGCAAADVTLFGELHGHPDVHRLELEVARGVVARREGVTLGAEMFEADVQHVVDEYLAGLIRHQDLVAEGRAWRNHDTDYRPLVDLAKDHGLRFVATNVPRRYASLVAREGLEALTRLSDEARRWVAPLPVTVDLATPGYREMLAMVDGSGHAPSMTPEHFVAAQAIKDATMADRIARHRVPGRPFVHVNGDYHSQGGGGIAWYLRRADPGLRVVVVSCVESAAGAFEGAHRARGDFVVLVPPTKP